MACVKDLYLTGFFVSQENTIWKFRSSLTACKCDFCTKWYVTLGITTRTPVWNSMHVHVKYLYLVRILSSLILLHAYRTRAVDVRYYSRLYPAGRIVFSFATSSFFRSFHIWPTVFFQTTLKYYYSTWIKYEKKNTSGRINSVVRFFFFFLPSNAREYIVDNLTMIIIRTDKTRFITVFPKHSVSFSRERSLPHVLRNGRVLLYRTHIVLIQNQFVPTPVDFVGRDRIPRKRRRTPQSRITVTITRLNKRR